MVRSIDQYRNCEPKAIADGSHAQILYALTDDKHDILVLWDFAVSTALQFEAMKREMAEKDERIAALEAGLKPFALLADELSIDMSSKPDDRQIWGFNSAELTYGDFRRARTLIQGEKK